MKFFCSFAAQSAILWSSVSGSSSVGQVFLNGASRASPDLSAIDLSTTCSIFAQILGLSQFYTLNPSDERIIERIGEFESPSMEVFGEFRKSSGRALIIVEGFSDSEVSQSLQSSHFSISDPPSSKSNFGLLNTFHEQASLLRQPRSKAHWNFGSALFRGFKNLIGVHDFETSASSDIALLHVNTLETLGSQSDKGSEEYSSAVEAIKHGLEQANAYAAEHDITLVVTLIPPTRNKARKWPEEKDMEAIKPSAKVLRHRSISDDDSFSGKAAGEEFLAKAKGDTVHGILPSCFSSLELCERITKNCTGHGTCAKLYGGKDNERPCYRCACEAGERKDEDGKVIKTTNYGGPACQKKDISVEFLLLAGFAIAMAFFLSWGIGLLYSIGQEELPSVLGAGVPGAKSK